MVRQRRELAHTQSLGRSAMAWLVVTLLVTACGSGTAATPTPTPLSAAATPTPTSTPTPSATATAAGTAPATASAPATSERTIAHIDVGGRTRDYAVVAPSDAANREPLPLLLFLHGRNVTPGDLQMEQMAGFDALAVEPGLIMVYPEGYQNTWNAGTCCQPATTDGIDDVAFLGALVDHISADYPVDPNRVFIGGDGTGGSMAYRAACDLADRFAAVAVVSGLLLADCNPANPIPALHIHGTEDHRGGSTTCDGPCPSVAQTMEAWRQADVCSGEPATTTEGAVAKTTYSACAGGVEVEFITVSGEQDTWLGPEPGDRDVIWSFLMDHPRSTARTQTATPAPTPIAVTGHIDVKGMTRDYKVVTPPDVADRDQLPLLIALHGRTGTIADAETISGYDAMAIDPGAVLVYPQGYGGSWNAGTCCTPATTKGIDDVGFLRALIDQMEAEYPIDPNRVFVAGGSNGGEMAYRAACELSDHIAAIADAMGTLLVDCHPRQPVSVIAIHGMTDANIPIDGGITDDPSCQDAPCPAFADTMERWRQIDGCTGDPTVSEDAYTVITSSTDCGGGTAVTFIAAKGKGHEWYTSNPDDRAVTWEFFMNHPRQ